MTVSRKPWERRLEDLAHLFGACGETYFDPDLFRRNTNQFLQTARTVTFIIQKNKADIPDFAEWYQEHVIEEWARDEVMNWAKDARNTIEKEGDLELHSTLDVSLIRSYLEEEDIKVTCGRSELLRAGVKKLVRFAQKQLPTGIVDAAGIKIERSWKTARLESRELLQALGYVYSRLFNCCNDLAQRRGTRLPKSIPEPSEVAAYGDVARQVEFVKLRDLRSYRLKTERIDRVAEETLPAEFKRNVMELKNSLGVPSDFHSAVKFYSGMAEATFTQWGSHIAMLFLLNSDWSVQYAVTPALVDQTDKYFFWRMIAERIRIQKPHCLVDITEVWIRDLGKYRPEMDMRDLPIRGERLQLAALDCDGNRAVITWPILRTTQEQRATLGEPEKAEESDKRIFFLVPAMRSMGLQPDFLPMTNARDE